MKLNKKQKQEAVDHNIQQAKDIINQAERVNKGKYVHTINVCMSRIKDLLKRKKPKTTKGKNFRELCKQKQALAALLYMTEKKI